MSQKRTTPLSVRLSPALDARLKECAERLRYKKHALAQDAIEAAVEAIEKNGYRLVVPIQFDVTHVAAPKETPGKYPAHQGERMIAAEGKDVSSTTPAQEKMAQAFEDQARDARKKRGGQ